MKLNGTQQLLVYADDVNILGGSVHTVKENAEALVVTDDPGSNPDQIYARRRDRQIYKWEE